VSGTAESLLVFSRAATPCRLLLLLLLSLLLLLLLPLCRGSALGVTLYPSYFSTGQLPPCANWVFIFEKTLPDQGGRSKIDGLLCDGGATLTHEIGHQMVS
jgi:hypothetical protein